jgi:hypothetical protein
MDDSTRLHQLIIELKKSIGLAETETAYSHRLLDQIQALVYDMEHPEKEKK